MGFKPPCLTFKLRFATEPWTGLEVICREGSVEQYEALSATPDDPQQRAEAFALMCATFAPALISWTLDDPITGEPTPPTLAGLRSHGITTVATIVDAWLDAVLMQHPVAPVADQDLADASELERQLADLSTTAA